MNVVKISEKRYHKFEGLWERLFVKAWMYERERRNVGIKLCQK